MEITPSFSADQVRRFGRLMEGFSLLTDRSNFLRQRCSGLGRMECQTLQILDNYRLRKKSIQERIRASSLSEEEILLYIPRTLRAKYVAGEVPSEVIDSLPRDLSMKALAEQIGVACSRMTRIGDTLSDEADPSTRKIRGKGLIHREASPDDRRVILIRITELGSEKVGKQGRNNERIAKILLNKIPPAELEAVERGLVCYLSALEEILPDIIDPDNPDFVRDDCGV
jgi:DNA-binding MarR family transcriptional regulator